jgi:hypothetical protein
LLVVVALPPLLIRSDVYFDHKTRCPRPHTTVSVSHRTNGVMMSKRCPVLDLLFLRGIFY